MTKAQKARELFSTTDMSIAEIAKQLGMHYSHAHSVVKGIERQYTSANGPVVRTSVFDVVESAERSGLIEARKKLSLCLSQQEHKSVMIDEKLCVVSANGTTLNIKIDLYVRNKTGWEVACNIDGGELRDDLQTGLSSGRVVVRSSWPTLVIDLFSS